MPATTRHDQFLQRCYASHLPLLAAVLATFKCRSCLEYGTGCYSTPLLTSLVDAYTGFEADPEWIRRSGQLLRTGMHRLCHLAAIPDADRRWQLSHGRGFMLTHHRKALEANLVGRCDLVFIDNNPWERPAVIQAVVDRCRILMLHDSEGRKAAQYAYAYGLQHLQGWGQVSYRPNGMPWTDAFFRDTPAFNSIDCARLTDRLAGFAEQYCHFRYAVKISRRD